MTPSLDMPLEAAMDLIATQVIAPLQVSGQLQGGYNIALAGTADKLRSTWTSLRWNLALAVLITYLLMAATFESWLYPFVVIVTVPIGAVGGFLGLWLLNWYVLQPLDVLTMLGFIMLVGTVVNNPILIVEQALVHIREDEMSIGEAVIESVRTRIRPIFMTTLGGLVGLLPLVIAPGAGSELYRGIGAVLLGGLFVSTIVTSEPVKVSVPKVVVCHCIQTTIAFPLTSIATARVGSGSVCCVPAVVVLTRASAPFAVPSAWYSFL